MHASAKQLYKTLFHTHFKVMQLIATERDCEQNEQSLAEHADTVFAVKQCLALVKEMTTQLNTLERLSTAITCARWVLLEQAGPIRTPYTTATPDVNMMVKTPNSKTEPEKYAEFCKHFGVTQEMIDSGTFQPHWPSMVKHISELATKGEPLPPHCDPNTQYPVYSMICRKNKDILDAKDKPDEI